MADVKVTDLDAVNDIPGNAVMYIIVDGVSYQTTKDDFLSGSFSDKLDRGGYSGTAQDLADASFKKNIFFTTSLADLGLSTFDELTNEIVADWIDSLEIVENDNEIYYYEITESSGIFDETFDETFE